MSGGLKQIKEHVRAVKNIKKITSSMKAVATAKFVNAEKQLRGAKPLGYACDRFYEVSRVKKEIKAINITFYAITSDRGLCGSMHTKVCKQVKLTSKKVDRSSKVVCVGEKGKSILLFDLKKQISLVVNGIGHGAPTFSDAGRIISKTLGNPDFTIGNIVYCKFNNMLSFDIDTIVIYSNKLLENSSLLHLYDQDHVDDLISFVEFSQTMMMYYALCETFLVELSSRITAMSNASKNAGKISDVLQLEYNRKRQQMVTVELIDIVSGANVISQN